MGLVLITHDMGVVAQTAHRVQVMYAGQVMEEQPAGAVRAPAPPLHRRPAGRAARAGGGQAAPAHHPRRGARHRRPPRRLPVRAALPLAHHAVQFRTAGLLPARAVPRCAATTRWTMPASRRAARRDRAGGGRRDPALPGPRRPCAEGGGRRVVPAGRRAHPGRGGRVRLRQVHPGPGLRPDGAADGRHIAIAGKPAGSDRTLQLQNQMVFQNPFGSLNPRRTIGAALVGAADHQPPRQPAGARGGGAEHAGPRGPAPGGVSTATPTCSAAASASASPSPAR